MLDVIFDGEAARVKDSDVSTEAVEDAGGFISHFAGVGTVERC